MLDFLKEYYYLMILILAIVILLLELILSFRVKSNQSVLSFIDKVVPGFVIDAESKFGSGHGDEKLTFCIGLVSTALARVFNIKDSSPYEGYIKACIEKVLITPQKKKGESL